jgi:hypothetical protein
MTQGSAPPPVSHRERRAHPRYAVKLAAEVEIPGRPPLAATVTELGPGGARLALDGLPPALGTGSRFRLGLRLPPDNPEGRFGIPVAVTGRTDIALSVFFLEAPVAFTRALARHLEVLAAAQGG